MSKSIAVIVGIVLLVVLVLFSMTYTVNFHEVAIKTRFGQVTDDSIVRDAGLKFRLPLFADKVTTFDTRLQLRESPLETVLTRDNQQVLVRAFLMWKVDKDAPTGPLDFYNSFSSIDEANQSMGDQFKTALRSGISRFTFSELLGSESKLDEAEKAILAEMATVRTKGIEPVTAGISQFVLPARTTEAVLTRMQATRTRMSEIERYKGNAKAQGIQTQASTHADVIRAFANRRAEEIRAQANADSGAIMTKLAEDEDLAILLQWLDAMKRSLVERTTIVIPAAFAPFHFLRLDAPVDRNGIPHPTSETQPDITATPADEEDRVIAGDQPTNAEPSDG